MIGFFLIVYVTATKESCKATYSTFASLLWFLFDSHSRNTHLLHTFTGWNVNFDRFWSDWTALSAKTGCLLFCTMSDNFGNFVLKDADVLHILTALCIKRPTARKTCPGMTVKTLQNTSKNNPWMQRYLWVWLWVYAVTSLWAGIRCIQEEIASTCGLGRPRIFF